jgi:hypothetical protein
MNVGTPSMTKTVRACNPCQVACGVARRAAARDHRAHAVIRGCSAREARAASPLLCAGSRQTSAARGTDHYARPRTNQPRRGCFGSRIGHYRARTGHGRASFFRPTVVH